jgi:hypothetical protein
LFETELLWGPENKEQSQLREPGDTLPVSRWETDTRGIIERGKA